MICDTDYLRPDENTVVRNEDNMPKLKTVTEDAYKRFE